MAKVPAAEQPGLTSDDAEREAFMVAVEDGLADLKAGRVSSHEQVQIEMRNRFGARAADQPRITSDEAERRRIVAKTEQSLAKLNEGQGVPHAEVLVMIDARYPGSK